MNVKKPVAACLKNLNAEEGMTQQELAECGDISVEYVRRLEYAIHSPSFTVMARLLHTNCGIDLNELAEQITDEEE